MARICDFAMLANRYWDAAFTLMHWKSLVGSTFAAFGPFLTDKGTIAKVTVDPDDESVLRKIVRYPDGSFWLAGDGKERKSVGETDVRLWYLDKDKVRTALARALQLHHGTSDQANDQLMTLGYLAKPGYEPVPVSLAVCSTIASTQSLVQQHLRQQDVPTIVFTLTETVLRNSEVMLARSKGGLVTELTKYMEIRRRAWRATDKWKTVLSELKLVKQRHGQRKRVRSNVMADLDRVLAFVEEELRTRLHEFVSALLADSDNPTFPDLDQKTIASKTGLTETQMSRLLRRPAAGPIKAKLRNLNNPEVLTKMARAALAKAERAQRKSE